MKFIKNMKKAKLERDAYRSILARQNKAAERQEYAKESEKQSRLRGKRLAIEKFNKKSFSQRMREGIIKNINRKPMQVKRSKNMHQVKQFGIKDLI